MNPFGRMYSGNARKDGPRALTEVTPKRPREYEYDDEYERIERMPNGPSKTIARNRLRMERAKKSQSNAYQTSRFVTIDDEANPDKERLHLPDWTSSGGSAEQDGMADAAFDEYEDQEAELRRMQAELEANHRNTGSGTAATLHEEPDIETAENTFIEDGSSAYGGMPAGGLALDRIPHPIELPTDTIAIIDSVFAGEQFQNAVHKAIETNPVMRQILQIAESQDQTTRQIQRFTERQEQTARQIDEIAKRQEHEIRQIDRIAESQNLTAQALAQVTAQNRSMLDANFALVTAIHALTDKISNANTTTASAGNASGAGGTTNTLSKTSAGPTGTATGIASGNRPLANATAAKAGDATMRTPLPAGTPGGKPPAGVKQNPNPAIATGAGGTIRETPLANSTERAFFDFFDGEFKTEFIASNFMKCERLVGEKLRTDKEFQQLFNEQRFTKGNVWKTAMAIQNKSSEQAAKLRANTQSVTLTSDAAIQGGASGGPATAAPDKGSGPADAGKIKPGDNSKQGGASGGPPTATPDKGSRPAEAGKIKPGDNSKQGGASGGPATAAPDKGSRPADAGKIKPGDNSKTTATKQGGHRGEPSTANSAKGTVHKGGTNPVPHPAPGIPPPGKGPGSQAAPPKVSTELSNVLNANEEGVGTKYDDWLT